MNGIQAERDKINRETLFIGQVDELRIINTCIVQIYVI